jgi:hypothetical protein|tara:strand:+ start:1436 stop:1855 length:420 start_codon:yes stop_codon:yes gene_type:complete
MKKRLTYWTIVRLLVPVIMIGSLMLLFLFFKPHPEWTLMEPSFELRAVVLLSEYRSDITKANSKYLNKVLSIEGKLTSTEPSLMIIDHGVTCTLDSTQMIDQYPALGTRVIIKGRCVGYDELLEEVRIDHVSVLIAQEK